MLPKYSVGGELPEIMPGVNPGVVTALDCPAAFLRAEQEMEFVRRTAFPA